LKVTDGGRADFATLNGGNWLRYQHTAAFAVGFRLVAANQFLSGFPLAGCGVLEQFIVATSR
jgi:hypothetical protein